MLSRSSGESGSSDVSFGPPPNSKISLATPFLAINNVSLGCPARFPSVHRAGVPVDIFSMEPVTHGLTSIALSRAGLNRVSRRATAILLVSGYVNDLDWLSLLGGPPMMLAYRRVPGHSLLGAAVLALLVAAVFWWFGRRHPTAPLRFPRVLLLSLVGVGSHLLLDLPNRYGCQLLWPFSDRWFLWGIVESVDPWPLVILLLGILLPALFRLVSEEIGARDRAPRGKRAAIIALSLVTLYFAGRAWGKARAEELLRARMYYGEAPVAVAAYAQPVSPFRWHGVVETENAVYELEVPIAGRIPFDPERGITHFKPDPSPALEAAQQTPTVRQFLRFARFPIARVSRQPEGYQVEVRDVRFHGDPTRWGGFAAAIQLDREFRVVKEEIRSVTRPRPQID